MSNPARDIESKQLTTNSLFASQFFQRSKRRIGRGVRAVGLNKDRRKSARQYAISGISGVCNPRETLENFRYNFTMRIGVGSVELTGGELDMCRRRVCFV